MKRHLLALSLLVTSGLAAEDCCSCCVPTCKHEIDCQSYTPQYNALPCSAPYAFADFLYWYGRPTNLSYALKTVTKIQTQPNEPRFEEGNIQHAIFPNEYLFFDVNWDPGLRFGLGWNDVCDGWDILTTWTYYHTVEKEKDRVPPFELPVPYDFGIKGLMNPWISQSLFQNNFFNKIDSKWLLNLNAINLEIGRKYWLSPCFSLRPAVGIKGAWTKTRFDLLSIFGPVNNFAITFIEDLFGTAKDRFTNRYWGIGLLGSLQPSWHFSKCFSLFSNLESALIWGEFRGEKKERYIQTEFQGSTFGTRINHTHRYKNDYFKMQAILDTAIGLRWEDTWCDCYRFLFDVGWEHHIWFAHNELYKYADQESATPLGEPAVLFNRTYTPVINHLVFGGLVVRARIDF